MNNSFNEDPVVAEIHAIRARMLADCDNDPEQLLKLVRQHQLASGRQIISESAKPRQPVVKQ